MRVLTGRRISVAIIAISLVLILLSVVTIVSDMISIKNADKHLANLHRNQIQYVDRINSINAAINVDKNVKEAMRLSLSLKDSVNDANLKRNLSLLKIDIQQLNLLYKNKSHIAIDFKKELEKQSVSGKIKIERFNKLQKILYDIINNPGSAIFESEPYSSGNIKPARMNTASRKRSDYAEDIEMISNAIANVRNRIRIKEDFVLHQFLHLSELHRKKAIKKYTIILRHIGLLMLLVFLQFAWLIFIIIATGRSSRRMNNATIDLAFVLSKMDLAQMKFALEKMTQIIDADAVLLGTMIDGGFINYGQFFIKKRYSAIIPSDKKYDLVIGKHAAGKAKASKKPIIINAYQKFSHAHQEWKKAGVREFAGAPLFYGSGEYFGQLSAIRFSNRKFTKNNLKILELFGNMIINLFENERSNKRINLFYERMKKLAYGILGGDDKRKRRNDFINTQKDRSGT